MSQTSSYSPLAILNPSVADLDRAEELAREERLKGDNTQTLNAFKVASLVKEAEFPVLHGHKGTSKFTNHLEEQERSWRLTQTDRAAAMTGAASVAHIIGGNARHNFFMPANRGTKLWTRGLEEKERARRLSDTREAASRRMRAIRLSDGIRVYGSTIRARLINRGSLWQKGKDAYTSVARNLPSAETVQHKAEEVAHTVSDAAAPVIANATSAAKTYIPAALNSLFSAATQVKDSIVEAATETIHQVQHAVQGDEELHAELSSVKAAEEAERYRRMHGDDSVGRSNARYVSAMLVRSNFSSRSVMGYVYHLNAIVERERVRRMANRDEAELRQSNALKVSRLLTTLGWPFIRSAKNAPGLSQFHFLAEEERERRMNDDLSSYYSRYNARKVSAMIKDVFLPVDSTFARGHIRSLEEKERRWRMKHSSAAMSNANREASLISNLGLPFFVGATKEETILSRSLEQENPLSFEQLNRLEEEERVSRANLQFAQVNARKVARMIAGKNKQASVAASFDNIFKQLAEQQRESLSWMANDTTLLAENERKSRLNDKYMQQLAKANAYKCASMIRKRNMSQLPSLPTSSLTNTPISAAPIVAPVVATKLAPLTPVAPIAAPVAPIVAPIAPPVPPRPVAAPVVASVVAPIMTPVAPISTLPITSTLPTTRPISTIPVSSATMTPVSTLPLPSTLPLTSTPTNASLLTRVQKLYDNELILAQKENQKASDLSLKKGLFSRQRARHHENKAQKHMNTAQQHQQWLALNGRPTLVGRSAF